MKTEKEKSAAGRSVADSDSAEKGNSAKKTDSRKRRGYTGDANSDFHTFFVDQIKDLYWAEKHLKRGLSKMCEAATSEVLAKAFTKHYSEGEGQIAALDTIFDLLGEKPEAKKCDAMAGLLKEAEEVISDTKRNSFVRDAGLILAAQKVEHYEIASYGTLCALSAYLSEKKIGKLLDRILSEEKKTDVALTKLAEQFINECAAVE